MNKPGMLALLAVALLASCSESMTAPQSTRGGPVATTMAKKPAPVDSQIVFISPCEPVIVGTDFVVCPGVR